MAFLIDTCVWIDVEQGHLGAGDVASLTRDEPVYLSPVVIAELSFGVEVARSQAVRQRRLAALRRIQTRPVLTIDSRTGELFGSVCAHLRRSGSYGRFRVQDLWLASQAIQHDFSLLTRNGDDFANVPGLDLVVYHLPRMR